MSIGDVRSVDATKDDSQLQALTPLQGLVVVLDPMNL